MTDPPLTALTAATTQGSDDPRAPADRPDPADRYLDQGRLGVGGMGEVRQVHDRFLDRAVARKVLHARLIGDARARARFEAEGSMTAGLEHPGIVPVYDRGARPDGRPWFTMKLIRGQTLAAAAAALSTREIVDAFARVCDAIAYAHARGVVHRDVKPANIMIGAFGEVLVLDWGIARRLDRDRRDRDDAPRDPGDAPPDALTHAGQAIGTPAYMPPEQIDPRRAPLGPPTDVYALGATLYRLVTGRPVHPGCTRAIWRAVLTGERPTLDGAPDALRPIIARALAHLPADRYPDAGALGAAIRRWLDGDARRTEARRRLRHAAEHRARPAQLRADAAAQQERADAILGPLPPFAPLDDKAPGWAHEDRAAEARRAARIAEVEYVQALHAVLEADPDFADGRAALTAHYRERLLDAEAHHDADRAAEYVALLRGHDPIGQAEWLRGDGAVTLVTDPPGAAVALYRFVEQRRRRVPVFDRALPPTPLIDLPLPMGSWLLRITAPGRHPVDYPVHIERAGRWDGVAPGESSPHAIWLPPSHAITGRERYVPAGWFVSGGDPDAPDGLPRRRVWLDAFVIERDPVTHGTYRAYLDALVAAGRLDDALDRVPLGDVTDKDAARAYRRRDDGTFELDQAFGRALASDWPVTGVDWSRAMAYAGWQTERDGHRWRLPHELEWVKAARGVDGRLFP